MVHKYKRLLQLLFTGT